MQTTDDDFDPSEEDFLSSVDLENIGDCGPPAAKRPSFELGGRPNPLQLRNQRNKVGTSSSSVQGKVLTVGEVDSRKLPSKTNKITVTSAEKNTASPVTTSSSTSLLRNAPATSTNNCAASLTSALRRSDKTSPTFPASHGNKRKTSVSTPQRINPQIHSGNTKGNSNSAIQNTDDSFGSELDLSLLASPANWNPTAKPQNVQGATSVNPRFSARRDEFSERRSGDLKAASASLLRTQNDRFGKESKVACDNNLSRSDAQPIQSSASKNTNETRLSHFEHDIHSEHKHSSNLLSFNNSSDQRNAQELRTPVDAQKQSIPPANSTPVAGNANPPVAHVDTGANCSNKTPSRSTTPTSSSATNSAKRKRKFPGPAGVLPKLNSGSDLNAVPVLAPSTPARRPQESDSLSQVPLSQSVEDFFSDQPWLAMKRDLESQAAKILGQFSLSNVVKKAGKKLLPNSKVPVVCAVIDSINMQNLDAGVVLKDPSGEMKGTIHREIMKNHEERMQVGSVLVLRQVGVFSPSTRSHYLNITPNNVVRVYSKDSEGKLNMERTAHFKQEDFIIQPPKPPAPKTPVIQSYTNQGFRGPAPNIPQSAWTTTGGPRFPAPSTPSLRPYRPPGPSGPPRSGQGQGLRSPYASPAGQHGYQASGGNTSKSSYTSTGSSGFNPSMHHPNGSIGPRSASSTSYSPSLIRPAVPRGQVSPHIMASPNQVRMGNPVKSGTGGTMPNRSMLPNSLCSIPNRPTRVTGVPSSSNVPSLIRPVQARPVVHRSATQTSVRTPGANPVAQSATSNSRTNIPTIPTGNPGPSQSVANKFTFKAAQNRTAHSSGTRKDNSSGTVADLWQDDQLDELLTDINDDDMFGDF